MIERRRAATPIASRPRGESVGSRSRDGDRRAKRVGQHFYPRRREGLSTPSHITGRRKQTVVRARLSLLKRVSTRLSHKKVPAILLNRAAKGRYEIFL